MRAMILAAGRGERLRPLTDHTPKPLLTIGGIALIEWQLRALKKAAISDVVINTAWLGRRIRESVGNGERFGLNIQYSDEGLDHRTALETAGGIRFALDLLGDEAFLVVNADVWTDYPLSRLIGQAGVCSADRPAFLVCVPNPAHHPEGDFCLDVSRETWGLLQKKTADVSRETCTFSGLGLYHPSMFAALTYGQAYKLGPLLEQHMEWQQVHAELYPGAWFDVGNHERLHTVRNYLDTRQPQHEAATHLRD